jgi:hypothetical protein
MGCKLQFLWIFYERCFSENVEINVIILELLLQRKDQILIFEKKQVYRHIHPKCNLFYQSFLPNFQYLQCYAYIFKQGDEKFKILSQKCVKFIIGKFVQ